MIELKPPVSWEADRWLFYKLEHSFNLVSTDDASADRTARASAINSVNIRHRLSIVEKISV